MQGSSSADSSYSSESPHLASDTPEGTQPSVRVVEIDAGKRFPFKFPMALGGIPGPTPEHPEFPDLTPLWREAGVKLVRSYDWLSRLDTRDNPDSLFPDWSADADDPSSYNFGQTDIWVNAVHSIGADVLFNFSSSIPQNKVPASDVAKYGAVVENIVRHYAQGWANGPSKPVRMFEFGDQPDLGLLHFDGEPERFYEMYEAFARAVKRVDPDLEAGGPSLAFPLNQDAPYRDQFLGFVRERGLPLDFYSYLWFVDRTRDPMDFNVVADKMRRVLDECGFRDTKLMLSYWNYLAVPTNHAPAPEKAAFQATAAIYLQDTAVDSAIFFRGDTGRDPHYGFVDPAGIFDPDGNPDERTAAFAMIGAVMSGQRLATTGSDESGFACLGSQDDRCVRALISNFVAPESALIPRTSDEYSFRIPMGPAKIELSLQLPPQREALASNNWDNVVVNLSNLPWRSRTVTVVQRSTLLESPVISEVASNADGHISLHIKIAPQSTILIEMFDQAERKPP